MQSKAENTKENNNGFNYMEIKEFCNTKISWTKWKGKGDTGKKSAMYLTDSRELALLYDF